MKIDSPTFLTETTFISASVQFSSGSQKFGNTADDIHQFTGSLAISGDMGENISGSSTSIGSFGKLAIGGGTFSGNEVVHIHRVSSNGSFMRISNTDSGAGATDGIIIGQDNSENTQIWNYENAQIYFGTNSVLRMTIEAGGDITFPVANQKISGSSTSTGSFGRVMADDYLQVGSTVDTSHAIHATGHVGMTGTLHLASSQGINWAHGDASIVEGGSSNYALDFYNYDGSGNNLTMTLKGNHDVVFPAANAKISGSSTSTGSFGRVHIGNSGTAPSQFANNLVINQTAQATAGISILTSNSGVGRIYFGDTDNQIRAYIIYDHGNDIMKFSSVSGNRLTLTATVAEFETANYKISGSSTSTGSFGSLYVDNRIGLGITNPQAYDTAVKNPVVIGAGASGGNNAGISVISATSGYGALYFGDGTGTSVYRGAVEYNHSTDNLLIWTSGTTGTGRAITIDSSNNTTFGGQIYLGSSNQLRIYSEGASGSDHQVILGKLNDLRIVNQHHGGNIRFEVENSSGTAAEAMRIDGDGNIGIGETSADGLLHIKGSTPNIIFEDTSGGSNSAILKFKKTSASEADDDAIGEIDFRGLNDADEEILYSYIVANSTDVSDGTEDGRLGFYVMNNGARPKLLELEGTKISGSGASTGSFGQLQIAGDTIKTDSGGRTTFIGDNAEVIAIRSNNANGSHIIFEESTTARGYVGIAGGVLTSGGDNFAIRSEADLLFATNGNNTRVTISDAGRTTFSSGGQIIYEDGNVSIASTKGIYFDGGTHTYIHESSGDNLRFTVGASNILDVTTTKISGSSTSTGSFGSLVISDAIQGGGNVKGGDFQISANDLVVDGLANATERGLVIKHSGMTSNTVSLVQDANNSRGELNTKNRSLFIQAGTDGFGSGERFRILVNQIASLDILNDGTVLFPVANQKISGSSTSTGSFGTLHIPNYIGVGTTAPDSGHLLTLQAGATGGDFLIAKQSDGGQAFRMGLDSGDDGFFEIGSAGTSDVVLLSADGGSHFKGGVVGIEVTPETDWRSANVTALQVGSGGTVFARKDAGETKIYIAENVKWTSDGFEYINNGPAAYHGMDGGVHDFAVASSGTADAVISATTGLRITNSANVEFPVANQKISGSSSSTGSFGHVIIPGRMVVGHPSVQTIASASSFQINDRGLTTIGLDLRHVTNDVGKGFMIRNLAGNQSGNVVEYGRIKNEIIGRVDGSHSGAYRFSLAHEGTVTERLTILNGGQVGIGIASPATKLHVKGAGEIMRIENDTNASGNTYMSFYDTSALKGYLGYTGGSSDHLVVYNNENADVRLFTNQLLRMTVTAGGNVEFPTANAKISGSSSSTGSFGKVSVGHSNLITNGAHLGVAGNINVGNGQSSAVVYFENSGTDMYVEGNASKLNIGSVGNTQAVTFPAGGGMHMNAGNISGSSTSTGSFGLLQTTDRIQTPSDSLKVKGNLTLDNTNIPTLHLDGLVDAIVRIDKAASYRAAQLRFDTAGSADWFIGTPDSDNYGDGDELYFGTSADTPIVAIDPQATTALLNLTSNRIIISGSAAGNQNDDGGLVLDLYNAYNADDARSSIRFWSKDPHENYGARLRFHHNNDWNNGAGTFTLALRAYDGSGLKDVIAVDGNQYYLSFPHANKISGSLNSTGSFGQLQIGHTPTHNLDTLSDVKHIVTISNHEDNTSGAFFVISGKQTSDANVSHISFCNDASSDTYKRIAEISARRVDEDNSGQLDFSTKNAGSWVSAFRMAKNGDLTATDTSIGSISDERTKQNIQTYSGSLSMVNTLRPVTFEWKSNRKKSGIQRGFVAQEITSSDAYWVRTEKVNENQEDYEYLGDATGSREALVSKLTEKDTMYVSAIQELTQAVRDLRAMITGSTDLNQLKAQVSSSSFV